MRNKRNILFHNYIFKIITKNIMFQDFTQCKCIFESLSVIVGILPDCWAEEGDPEVVHKSPGP